MKYNTGCKCCEKGAVNAKKSYRGTVVLNRWSEKISLRKLYLSKNLKEFKDQTM